MLKDYSVVFDMDGVLFDTQRIYTQTWFEVAQLLHIDDIKEPAYACRGLNRNDQRTYLMDYYHGNFPYDEFFRLKNKIFDGHLEKGIPLKEGTREILQFLKEQGVKTAIASSSRVCSVVDHVEKTGLARYFDKIVGGDTVVHSKPDPEIYLLACRELGVEPSETFAVEDSYNGLYSAIAAGMMTIMIPDTMPPTEELDRKIYRRFNSLLEFRDFLCDAMGKNSTSNS